MDTLIIEGKIMIESTRIAANNDEPSARSNIFLIAGTRTSIPIKPKTTVGQNENAIGYASLSAVNDSIKVLSFNGVVPSEETVLDKSYKLQRPFVFVLNKAKQPSKDAKAFIDYAMSDEAKPLIVKAGVVPAKK